MISNQKFEIAVSEILDITKLECAVYSIEGNLIAASSTCNELADESVRRFIDSGELETDDGSMHFFRISVEDEAEYIMLLEGADYQPVVGRLAANQIRIIGLSFAEMYDRTNFMQNVVQANLLPIDLLSKAKKLHIENEAKRAVFVIDTAKKNSDMVLETVKNFSNIKGKDFVFRLDEKGVVLVKTLPGNCSDEELDALLLDTANLLVDNIHMEVMVRARIGYGNIADSLKEVARSYQEACLALEVGRVFYAEKDTISYDRLGIGRLIYQLPYSLCEMFIKEVFGENIPDILDDEEAMITINKFYENSLNISETARQLYLHRNTLVYRLERIQNAVGLDIRNFEDAMTFRIAVMVLAHMKEKM